MSTTDETALLTGATAGIGRWTALGLARGGIRVLATTRDTARGEALRRWVLANVPTARIDVLEADFASLGSVQRLAAAARAAAPQLDILINNAGLLTDRRRVSADGFELTLAVNHLAPFLLTRALLPTLSAAPAARVVNVGSSASDAAILDLADLQATKDFGMMKTYGRSKLALLLTSFEWARRLQDSSVTVNVVHPGAVATEIGKLGGAMGLLWRGLKPFLLTPEQGARTTLHVAMDLAVAGVTGTYFKQSAPATPNPLAGNHTLAARLWTETERLLAEAGF